MQIPTASANYLQLAIPVFIAAFLTDVGIADYFTDLEWIAAITPSDKCLDTNMLLSQEYIFYKIASYIMDRFYLVVSVSTSNLLLKQKMFVQFQN